MNEGYYDSKNNVGSWNNLSPRYPFVFWTIKLYEYTGSENFISMFAKKKKL